MNRYLKHWRLTGRGEAFRAHVVSYADDFVILSRGCATEVWLPKISSGWRRCRDGLSSVRDDRPLEAARRIARRTIQIACGSRSGDGISPPAACCPEAVGASEAQAAHCRSPNLRLALSAVPLLARSRG